MTGKRLQPPRSMWGDRIKNSEHYGAKYPELWDILLDTLDILLETSGQGASAAGAALKAMLEKPLTSESLVVALFYFRRATADPIAQARAEIGDFKRTAERVRIQRTREKLDRLPDQLLSLGDDLKLAALSIEHRDGAPTGKDVGYQAQLTWLRMKEALQPLLDLADKAEQAAPAARGRQPNVKVRARLRLVSSVFRSYALVRGNVPDEPFWILFRTLWEALTNECTLPEEQRLREHIRDEFSQGRSEKG